MKSTTNRVKHFMVAKEHPKRCLTLSNSAVTPNASIVLNNACEYWALWCHSIVWHLFRTNIKISQDLSTLNISLYQVLLKIGWTENILLFCTNMLFSQIHLTISLSHTISIKTAMTSSFYKYIALSYSNISKCPISYKSIFLAF